MEKTILSFGEVLWDILPNAITLGGAPFNFTYRVNCLGDKGIMVSRLGRDALGEQALEKIRELGVDPTYIQRDKRHPTGTVRVSFDEAHNPSYVIIPEVAYDYIETNDALLAVASQTDCLCFGTLAQRNLYARQTLRRIIKAASGTVKLLDINLRKDCYSPQTITSSLAVANILKLNLDEARQLAGMLDLPNGAVDRIVDEIVQRYGIDCCIVTLGASGALAVSAQGEKVYVPGHEVQLVDSLGCGDAFSAGFIYQYLRNAQLAECCSYGNTLGAIVAAQKGGTVPLGQDDIMQFRSCRKGRISEPLLEKFTVE